MHDEYHLHKYGHNLSKTYSASQRVQCIHKVLAKNKKEKMITNKKYQQISIKSSRGYC